MRSRRWLRLGAFAAAFLLLASHAQERGADEEAENTDDESAPPQRPPFAQMPPLVIDQPNSAASFGNQNLGKITWRVERSRLPWRGSYSFLSKSDSEHPTVLLTVLDARTGLKIADCQTPVSLREPHRGWRGELDRAFHWHRVNWELDEDALQCNTTADLKTIRSELQSKESTAFVVKISAAHGPRCIRNLHADEEEWSGCPPTLRMHAFQSVDLRCGCAEANSTAEPRDEQAQELTSDSTLEPVTDASDAVTDDPPIFGSVRRRPMAARLSPATASREESSPAFPMFQFTSSMEKTESTKEPESSTTAEITSAQQTETTAEVTPNEETAAIDETATLPSSVVTAEEETAATTESSAAVTSEDNGGEKSCDTFECQNNGTCIEPAPGQSPECKCADGFGGEHCERDLCGDLGCQNGGKCQVRNGRAVCSCPRGLHGEKCHQTQPICNPPCENGGACSLVNGQSMCRCPHGFLGSNCNLRDLCANDATCRIYGPTARCFKEAGDLYRYSNVLQDASYSCQCPTGNGYAECNSTLASQERFGTLPVPTLFSTPASIPRISPDSFRSTSAARLPDPSSVASIETSAAGADTSAQQPTQQSAEFPIHSTALGTSGNVDSRPTIQRVIGSSPEEEQPVAGPRFPLTSLTPQSASSIQTTILSRPTPIVSSTKLTSQQFTRLPNINRIVTTSTPAIPSIPASGGDENEGDSEFERMTQILSETTAATSTTSGETNGAVGPEHSIEGGATSNELQPEFHTVAPPTGANTENPPNVVESAEPEVETPPPFSIGPTVKTTTTDAADVSGNADAEIGERVSRSWQWIAALAVVGVLLIAASIGGVIMARYVRRSRRLHGKYNPAREENAAIAHSTFAMPMTAVNKDERLI